MNIFSTIINKDYILRGLTLYKSLEAYLDNDKFIIFCIDQESYDTLENYKSNKLLLIPTNVFEDNVLLKLKKIRKINEFCWTLKPFCLSYIFKKFKITKWAIYLDSDSMVFNYFTNVLDDNFDILITPHNPSNKDFLEILKDVGIYNAGFVGFKNTKNAKLALRWWSQKCKECCSGLVKKDSYADQKYLDKFPKKFNKVNSNSSNGLNVAPWNIMDNTNTLKITEKINQILVFYHMQGLKIYNKYIYDLYSDNYKVNKETYIKVYKPYIRLLKQTYKELTDLDRNFRQKKELKIDLKFLIKKLIIKNNNIKVIINK